MFILVFDWLYLFIYLCYSSTALMRLIKCKSIWQFITQFKNLFQITSIHPFCWRTSLVCNRNRMNCMIFIQTAFQNQYASVYKKGIQFFIWARFLPFLSFIVIWKKKSTLSDFYMFILTVKNKRCLRMHRVV